MSIAEVSVMSNVAMVIAMWYSNTHGIAHLTRVIKELAIRLDALETKFNAQNQNDRISKLSTLRTPPRTTESPSAC